MRLKDLGHDFSEAQLAEYLGTTEQGAKIMDIPNIIPKISADLKVAGQNASFDDLQTLVQSNPAIISVSVPGKGTHAIIVDDISNGQVFIRDPLPIGTGSAYSVPVNDFKPNFNGKIVVISKNN